VKLSYSLGALILITGSLSYCASQIPSHGGTETKNEKEWRTLFDGHSLAGWRGFKSKVAPASWELTEGAIHRKPGVPEDEGGDLCSEQVFQNFELEFTWRIAKGGNSGVKYLIREDRPTSWERASYDYSARELRKRNDATAQKELGELSIEKFRRFPIGFEYQIVDPAHPDSRASSKRVTSALYDLLAPPESPPLSDDFNRSAIVVHDATVQHWLNGVKVLEFNLDGTELKEAISRSKFRDMPGFGRPRPGHICLQDHGDEVWFRTVRIR
jgi:hypothetical protein